MKHTGGMTGTMLVARVAIVAAAAWSLLQRNFRVVPRRPSMQRLERKLCGRAPSAAPDQVMFGMGIWIIYARISLMFGMR